MTKLKAGLIGLGMMGRHHARVLQSLDGVELAAVADPGGDRFGVSSGRRVLKSIDEVIRAGVDYCVVAVPTAAHLDVGLALAGAGVHALIEKPLASDTATARKLADAFDSAGLIGAVGHIERYNPALVQARQRIDEGEIGAVFQVTTRRQGPFPARISDVGVIKDLATHDIDLTSWITQQRFKAVSARTAHRSGRVHEDLVAIVGQLSEGTVTSHLVNWLSPLKERVTVITGEKGTLVADTLSVDLTFYANGTVPTQWDSIAGFRGVSEGDIVRYAFAKKEPLLAEHEALRDAIQGKPGRIVTMQEGLSTVEVADAVIESSMRGATIQID